MAALALFDDNVDCDLEHVRLGLQTAGKTTKNARGFMRRYPLVTVWSQFVSILCQYFVQKAAKPKKRTNLPRQRCIRVSETRLQRARTGIIERPHDSLSTDNANATESYSQLLLACRHTSLRANLLGSLNSMATLWSILRPGGHTHIRVMIKTRHPTPRPNFLPRVGDVEHEEIGEAFGEVAHAFRCDFYVLEEAQVFELWTRRRDGLAPAREKTQSCHAGGKMIVRSAVESVRTYS